MEPEKTKVTEERPGEPRVAVLGGGISGLAATHRLIELSAEKAFPLRVTLLEASPRLGGVIRTSRRDGFLLESGPDSFITDKPWALQLAKRIGLENEVIGTNPEFRRSYVVLKGRLLPVPEGFYLLAPSAFWPMVATPIFSWPGKLRMALDLVIPRKISDEDESLADFVRRRLGREALERMAQPMVSGIHAADPESLSLQAVMPRFVEMERTHGSIIRALLKSRQKRVPARGVSGPRYGLFATFQDGMQTLVDALVSKIPPGAVRLNASVTELGRGGEGWTITLTSGEALQADAVVVTLPATAAARLLRPVDFVLSDLLGGVPYASTVTANFAYPDVDVPYPLDGFGFVVPAIENRPLIGCTFSSVKFAGRAPGRHVLLRLFLGGATCDEAMQLDDAELESVLREQLRQLLGVTAPPLFTSIERHSNAMPDYTIGHLDRVHQVRERVAGLPGLALAGNAFHGVGVPDCIHSAETAADAVLDALAAPPKPALQPIA